MGLRPRRAESLTQPQRTSQVPATATLHPLAVGQSAGDSDHKQPSQGTFTASSARVEDVMHATATSTCNVFDFEDLLCHVPEDDLSNSHVTNVIMMRWLFLS